MKFIPIKGAVMPALGFGTWRLQEEVCERAVQQALDAGYRLIDTAQIYENEVQVGRALAKSGMARKELFVTTKIWITNLGADRIAPSMEQSLSKLQMDYVDLLLIHWPVADLPLKEMLDGMRQLLDKGKTKAIGVSNYPVEWMRRAVEEYKAPIACNQIECHVLLPQRKVIDYAHAHDITITAYCPLARGELTDNEVLKKIGKKYGKNANQIALRWLVEQGVASIPKSTKKENLKANFEIFDFALDDADLKAIAGFTQKRLVNPTFAPQWDTP